MSENPERDSQPHEDDDLFESLLELGDAAEPAVLEPDALDTDELGETNRVPGLVRGSSGTVAGEPSEPDAGAEVHTALALVLEDGRRIALDHTVVLGRSPSARGDDSEQLALDPALTDISRNHLEIRVAADAVVALDLASTNGTVLTRAGQVPRLVPTDEPIRLLPGDSLNLGGSAIVEIEAVR